MRPPRDAGPDAQFWANQLDYNDRNEFPAGPQQLRQSRPTGGRRRVRVRRLKQISSSIANLGSYLTQVIDGNGLPFVAIAVTQQPLSTGTRRPAARATPSSGGWSARS
jgi:hypothetical protein